MSYISPWTPKMEQRLRDLIASGMSYKKIGAELGFTKSALIGKAKRLGLDRRPSPIRPPIAQEIKDQILAEIQRGNTVEKTALQFKTSKQSVMDIRDAAGIAPLVSRWGSKQDNWAECPTVTLDVLTSLQDDPELPQPVPTGPSAQVLPYRSMSCCWPLGEPGKRNFRFCDDTCMAGKPYCGEHAALAYVKVFTPAQKQGVRSASA